MPLLPIAPLDIENKGQFALGAFYVFVSWIGQPLLVVFVSRGRNLIITIAFENIAFDWRCLIITRHSYWERRSWSKQDNRICFAREKINYMRCESSCHDWCFNFVRERPAPEARRRNLWCLSGPAEKLSRWYRPSARGSTYDWQNCRSFLSILAECGLALKLHAAMHRNWC